MIKLLLPCDHNWKLVSTGPTTSQEGWHCAKCNLWETRYPDAAPSASPAPHFETIAMGYGKVDVGDAIHDGLPALWFGRNGNGMLGSTRNGMRVADDGETIILFTFANIQGLEAIERAVADVRRHIETGELQTGDGQTYLAAASSQQVASQSREPVSFQQRVQPWMLECFGAEIAADTQERNHRFLEEALELVQACGATQSEAHQLVDYVYGRPVGEKAQEVGGVMVTLAALCLAQGLDMHEAGETELARIWAKVEQIRAKQAAKPKHSPLPEHVAAPQPSAKALTDEQILAEWDKAWASATTTISIRKVVCATVRALPATSQPSEDSREPMFYVQDTRQFVGNCVMWWGKNRSGYVTRLNEAGKYTLDEASRICERATDRMWPCEQIDALAHPTVDMQHLPRKSAKGVRS